MWKHSSQYLYSALFTTCKQMYALHIHSHARQCSCGCIIYKIRCQNQRYRLWIKYVSRGFHWVKRFTICTMLEATSRLCLTVLDWLTFMCSTHGVLRLIKLSVVPCEQRALPWSNIWACVPCARQLTQWHSCYVYTTVYMWGEGWGVVLNIW